MQRGPLIGGRYDLGRPIGGGGMAEVFLARDEVLDRDVALKILRERYANDEDFVERFRREARSAAALNHPNIVQVYDQGRTEEGAHYIAMEYVPGGTLAELMKREGPLAPSQAAGVASQVADALAAAHASGIVHRDIKPQNVLLTDGGDVKVTDFGIARAASAETMTDTRLILGTAAYMSPEQVKGERAGPASDLYSLGVVLFEMLTGETPFTADNPVAASMKHVDEPPRHPREVNPAVPRDLDALTTKLLAKRPEDRYASAADLADDLRRAREGLPLLAAGAGEQATARMRATPTGERTAPTVAAPARRSARSRSRRRLLGVGALLLAAILLGALAWALTRGTSNVGAPGVARVEVPQVVGLSVQEAQGRLEAAGLELGSTTEAVSDQFEAGILTGQDPTAGSEADRGTAVDVIVSSGPAPVTTSSPSAAPSPSPSAPSTSSSTASSTPAGGTTSGAAAAQAQGQSREDAREARQEAKQEAKDRRKERREAAKEQKKGD